jgi:hypothetical protein
VATAGVSEAETKLLSSYNPTEFGVPQPGTSAPKYSWLGATGLSSEFGASGASSKGGGAYEPLIGRALQSSALASPGSFPDGTGGVGIVQASYVSSLSEQMLQIALEHEAAQEAAARAEAEAKAREEAVFDECPASACHVDGPGEGNCEVNCVTSGGAEEGLETEGEGASISNVHASGPHQVGPCRVHSRGDPASLDDATFWSFSSWADCLTAVYNVSTWNVVGGLVSTIELVDYIPANQKISWHGSLETLPDVDSGEFCFFGHYSSKGHDRIFGQCLPMTPTI